MKSKAKFNTLFPTKVLDNYMLILIVIIQNISILKKYNFNIEKNI